VGRIKARKIFNSKYIQFHNITTRHMWHIGRVSETCSEGCRSSPGMICYKYYFCILRHQINNTNNVTFISFTVTVNHVVGGRNKQVLSQWICLRCNIQFDNMGSVIFFECHCTFLYNLFGTSLESIWSSCPHHQAIIIKLIYIKVTIFSNKFKLLN
jgi:hypothetical protein